MTIKPLHDGEIIVDEELARRLVSSQFPRWANEKLTPVSSSGTVNVLYRLGDGLCLRFSRLEQYAESIERELEWLPQLSRALSIATPVPVARGEPQFDYPFAWGVFEWLPGRAFEPGRLGTSNRTARRLAQFNVELQQVAVTGGPKSSRELPLSATDPTIAPGIEAMSGVADTNELAAVWQASLAAPNFGGQPVWVHGDLIPPNLLMDGGELSAVIDFGLVGIGDPAIDLIPAWTVLRAEARTTYRSIQDVDEATWARARGMAFRQAIRIVPYYRESHPDFARMAIDTLHEIVADWQEE